MKLRTLALAVGAMILLVPATLLAGGFDVKVTDKAGKVTVCRVLTGTYIRPTAKEGCNMAGRLNRTYTRQNIEATGALNPMSALSVLDANYGPAVPSYAISYAALVGPGRYE